MDSIFMDAPDSNVFRQQWVDRAASTDLLPITSAVHEHTFPQSLKQTVQATCDRHSCSMPCAGVLWLQQ